MPSDTFKRADTRFIAAAMSDNTTHAGITTFETSLGLTTQGNKGERANSVVRFIYDQSDTDALLIDLLNYLFVENPWANTSDANESYVLLRDRVLAPRGVRLTDDGFVLSDGRGIDDFDRTPTATVAPRVSPAEPLSESSGLSLAAREGSLEPVPEAAKVFVVHGRDLRPVHVVQQFLQFLGLHMMSWSEAVALTREPQPHTYSIVRAGITHAGAIIVIFSPDDLARVKDEFSEPDDADRTPQGQTRQNVTLEAGMAFATAPNKTIFLRSAATREISDIAGFNWVKLDGEWDSRNDLKQRLESAGAAVRTGSYDLGHALAGPFRILP